MVIDLWHSAGYYDSIKSAVTLDTTDYEWTKYTTPMYTQAYNIRRIEEISVHVLYGLEFSLGTISLIVYMYTCMCNTTCLFMHVSA